MIQPPPSRFATGALALAVLLPSLGTSIANISLPALVEVFGASFHHVQWVVLAYLLGMTTLSVSVGRLGDLWGRRRLLLAGIVLFTLAAGVCGGADNLGVLIAARTVQGLAAAILLALAFALAGEIAPRERLGATLGVLGTMSAVGTALGPSLGGLLISELGWRAVFLFQVPLGLIALVLARYGLPDSRPLDDASRPAFDCNGTFLLALSLAAYALAMTLGRGHFGALNVGLLAAAFAGALLFWRVEARSEAPLLRIALFRDWALTANLMATALVATVLMTTLVAGPFYLAQALHLDAARSGLVLSVGPLVAALCGVPAGRLVDRIGVAPTVARGLVAIFVGTASLALALPRGSVGGYLAGIVIITAGYSFFQTANNAAVLGKASASDRGAVSGLLNLLRNIGLITGASVMSAVYAFGSETAPGATQVEAAVLGMKTTLAVASGIVLAAIGLARWGNRRRSPVTMKIAQNSPSFRSA